MNIRQTEEEERTTRDSELKKYWSLSSLGMEIGIAFGIGVLIGWYLDRYFGTRPWLTLAFSFFGIAAGFRNIVRLARKDWDEKYDSTENDSTENSLR